MFDYEANSIRMFLQDEQYLIWIGTNKGLFSYDGYEFLPHYAIGSGENTLINCGLFFDEDYLLLGTEKGVLMYNYKYDKYVPFSVDFDKDTRSIVHTDNDFWFGCADGLYRYNTRTGELVQMTLGTMSDTKPFIIHALASYNGYVYACMNGVFGRFSEDDYVFEQLSEITIPICSLRADPARNCIWIGTATHLTQFELSSKTFSVKGHFPVVKTITLDDDNNLVLGTDNGLYVHNESGTRHYVHNTLKVHSLANDVIWNVFTDKSGNVWLGTDHGISISPHFRSFEYYPLFNFTNSADGNQFYCIHKDSKGYYWFGGDNGLIRTTNWASVAKELRWYKRESETSPILNNHIRDLFEDTDHTLWAATDYGICKYDDSREAFQTYIITSPQSSHSAGWAYDITEDRTGHLWVSSYNGGVFKVDKDRFATKLMVYANDHYSTQQGLTSNNIDQIVLDKSGNVWALNRNREIDIIHDATGRVRKFIMPENSLGNKPTSIFCDAEGFVWILFNDSILKVDPESNDTHLISFEKANYFLGRSLTEVGNNICATTSNGLCLIDKKAFTVTYVSLFDKMFNCAFYDNSQEKILLGGIDEIAAYAPPNKEELFHRSNLIISSLLVNGRRYTDYTSPAIRYCDQITLPFNQNYLVVKFSDLCYTQENRKNTYLYKVDKDANWTVVKTNDKSITLSKMEPGKHRLVVGEITSTHEPIKEVKSFEIVITPAWYYTFLAKVFYFILLFGLVIWGVFFYRQRNKLRFERVEKEKTLEQTERKIDFFTNIAHEFKTPLSLIIAPLSGLIHESKNENDRNIHLMMQQNAMKLNSLVQQAIDFYRDNSQIPIGLILSYVELVEFAKCILSTHEENMRVKGAKRDFFFNSNTDKLYVNVDVLKIESILNNLLSNACKYTNEGDSIIMSLEINEKEDNLIIKVSDTGIGIPPQDLPYIFQRFYQSPSNAGREGTGIGLYMVEIFTKLHSGTVNVVSNPSEGTTFTITLPATTTVINQPLALAEQDNATSSEKPLMVVVEDNVAIAAFIYNIFVPKFRCVRAYNGKTGLKLCIDMKPDIIIADIMMPVMDGLEMCKRLKMNMSTSTIPLILLTAKDDKETELKSISLKVDAYITKPFDSNILYSRAIQLLEAHKQLGKQIRIEKIATPAADNAISEDERFLALTTKIIEDHIDDLDMNVNFLCTKMNVPQKQLYRKIKLLTGLTAVEYIKSIRMKKAALLLSNKNFTIAEVMYKVGFSNHSYFAKCFFAHFGKTPKQYLEQ